LLLRSTCQSEKRAIGFKRSNWRREKKEPTWEVMSAGGTGKEEQVLLEKFKIRPGHIYKEESSLGGNVEKEEDVGIQTFFFPKS